MNEIRPDWLRVATEISSFRQMYRLAGEIADSEVASDMEKRAARRVVGTLRQVIDAPIADAAILAKARKRFGRLVKSLQVAA